MKLNPNYIFVIKNDMTKTVMSNTSRQLTPLKSSNLQKTDFSSARMRVMLGGMKGHNVGKFLVRIRKTVASCSAPQINRSC